MTSVAHDAECNQRCVDDPVHNSLQFSCGGKRYFVSVYLGKCCSILSTCSFIHSGYFYSASSSPLLLRGASKHSTNAVYDFHAEAPQGTNNNLLLFMNKQQIFRSLNHRSFVLAYFYVESLSMSRFGATPFWGERSSKN